MNRIAAVLALAAVVGPSSVRAQLRPEPKEWYRGADGHYYNVDNRNIPEFIQRSVPYNLPDARALRQMQEDARWRSYPCVRPHPYYYPRRYAPYWRRGAGAAVSQPAPAGGMPAGAYGEGISPSRGVAPVSVFEDPKFRLR